MNVAVILARGGSKRIPKKNIKIFCGKPIIAWTIELAKKSNLFDRIIVSTDDETIAEISKSYGAEVPFMRPSKFSDDNSDTLDVMSHAVSWMNKNSWKTQSVCCLYGTSVFFTIDDIKKAFEIFKTNEWSYVFSVTDFGYPIFRSFKQLKKGGVEMFFPENYKKRSQDLPLALHDAAQFYLGKPDAWLRNAQLFEQFSYPVKIPQWRVQDIDTKDDWKRAELIYQQIKEN